MVGSELMQTDFIVVGAGIAGLRAAITLAQHAEVLVVTKEQLGESNTSYAQGGIAVAISGEEDVEQHWRDTLAAGDGLVDTDAARVLVTEGPARVGELLRWGTSFDRYMSGERRGELMLTREGAHSNNRILHAHGDATGAEIGRALLEHARTHPRIRFREWSSLVDLLVDDHGLVAGVTLLGRDSSSDSEIRAQAVLLASGGAGQVYSDTTNPAVATGDGIAAAWRAGTAIEDMEFYQFHPTALSLPGVPRFLLSEALRGEGAVLVNDQGQRFMERYHPLLDLAPRDVVARAITREGLGEDAAPRPVYLDMRHVAAAGMDLRERFPGISAFLEQHGLRLERDLIPVRPAAHYLMGGVQTDVDGRTSLRGLYAAGEVACTGVHGANRLASNSLLEGLVFGARAAEAMLGDLPGAPTAGVTSAEPAPVEASSEGAAEPILLAELRSLMWREAGLLRDEAGLDRACTRLAEIGQLLGRGRDRASLELNNLHAVATLITRAASARQESRGGHFRSDYPRRDDLRFQKHSVVVSTAAPRFAAHRSGADAGAAARRQ
ncbi:MAG TPA: L-aspartate oxidase [Acidobacteriaceae bacterium]